MPNFGAGDAKRAEFALLLESTSEAGLPSIEGYPHKSNIEPIRFALWQLQKGFPRE
jgi:hypothetical protein